MNREEYIRITNEKLSHNCRKLMLNQIERYYSAKEYHLPNNEYQSGDEVKINKGTLLHGTYKNIDGLKEILKDGLISSWFIDGRMSSVGVWNLKHDYMLKDYIDFYSGGTIKYSGLLKDNEYSQDIKTMIKY